MWFVCQSCNHPIFGSSNTGALMFHGVNTAGFFQMHAHLWRLLSCPYELLSTTNDLSVACVMASSYVHSQRDFLSVLHLAGRWQYQTAGRLEVLTWLALLKAVVTIQWEWCTVFMISDMFVQESWMTHSGVTLSRGFDYILVHLRLPGLKLHLVLLNALICWQTAP